MQNDYNIGVDVPVPSKPEIEKPEHQQVHVAYSAEATGLLVMAVVVLAVIVISCWRYIPWGAR